MPAPSPPSSPTSAGMTSSGFVGQNDGWTDLKGSTNCGSGTCPDYTMSYTYSSANNGNTAQTGQIDLSDAGAINLTTATTATFRLGLGFRPGRTSAVSNAESTLNGTLGDATNMLNTYVTQWNTFDNGLTTPPLYGSTMAIKNARQQESYLATNMLKASQDKTTNAIVAAHRHALGRHQRRRRRRRLSPRLGARHVRDRQRPDRRRRHHRREKRPHSGSSTRSSSRDGHFPQNSFVNGTPNWTGIQEDESGLPDPARLEARRHRQHQLHQPHQAGGELHHRAWPMDRRGALGGERRLQPLHHRGGDRWPTRGVLHRQHQRRHDQRQPLRLLRRLLPGDDRGLDLHDERHR